MKNLLLDSPEVDAEWVWREIENRRSNKEKLLDLKELDAVSGGYVRDWTKEGCAATCPDGHKHVFDYNGVCTRCGYFDPDEDYHPTQGQERGNEYFLRYQLIRN